MAVHRTSFLGGEVTWREGWMGFKLQLGLWKREMGIWMDF